MAFLKLYRERLNHNFHFLNNLFGEQHIEWGVVSKLLCGNEKYLNELVDLGIREMHDTRVSNLRTIKEINPDVQTVYIKPPAKRNLPEIVQYADVSFNTELSTIRLLSEEAKKQDREHKVIIMIELGDLREGVLGDRLIDFYGKIFELPNIEVVGIGSNLNCLHGVMPSEDKLVILSLYKQLIEATFNKKIRWVSGGTTVTLPMLLKKQLPAGINHFRVGEALFFGINLFTQKPIPGMHTNVFRLFTEIIELHEKPKVPSGQFGEDPQGQKFKVDENDYGKTSYRAILDVGLLDVKENYLKPVDSKMKVVGSSSDMLVVDLGESKRQYKVGDLVQFDLKYMGALGLMNSDYIDKMVV
jgi:predicted amino acid racemase